MIDPYGATQALAFGTLFFGANRGFLRQLCHSLKRFYFLVMRKIIDEAFGTVDRR